MSWLSYMCAVHLISQALTKPFRKTSNNYQTDGMLQHDFFSAVLGTEVSVLDMEPERLVQKGCSSKRTWVR